MSKYADIKNNITGVMLTFRQFTRKNEVAYYWELFENNELTKRCESSKRDVDKAIDILSGREGIEIICYC